MPNILYFPTRYFPSISGAEFYIQRLAEIFSLKYNYNTEIFTSNAIDFRALRCYGGKIISNKEKLFNIVNNIRIKRFPIDYENNLEKKLTILKKFKEYRALNLPDNCTKKLLENGPFLLGFFENLFKRPVKKRYDLVHTTFYPYFNLVYSLMVSNFYKIPAICTPFFHFANPRYFQDDTIEILKKFELLIACTKKEKDFLTEKQKIHEKKIKVIPMGVDYQKFENNKKNQPYYFKNKFFNLKEKKYKMVLFCGYKNYEKGAISILKAIPLVLQKIKKVYFIFIGPSTLAFNRELSKIHKIPNVRIINFTPDNLTGYFDKKKISAFKEMDIYIMPSRSDAFGIAFLEAWAAGKPVIGANIGATPEVIRENIDGMLVEFDNVIDISKKLIILLKKKRLRKKLGSAGQKKVKKKYTWDCIAYKTHLLYEELIKKKV
ncbi:MAG: glycosyltransferase family 4 protein [Promethearchaeota archaeon]